ncbi:dephospho-CoA kinase [Methylibium sp.]|uniref:dephospho-CoA kinase n=1 Tax=Methylibium sp. TaxID=2067992 RepID=UPI00286B413B|nr:dephospho-CoA kinase [Methylibium sp.]
MAAPAHRSVRIGLTGGIGSGKSTIAAILQARGAQLIDTDAISRSLTARGGAAIDTLRAHFGAAAINAHGALDRRWMRERAFANAGVKRDLEAVLHPLIGARCDELAAAAAGQPCIVFDVPLLVESHRWRMFVDRVLVVDCPFEVQIARVMRRSLWQREQVQSVIAQQAPRAVRRAAADAVIDNRVDDLAELQANLEALWRLWLPSP